MKINFYKKFIPVVVLTILLVCLTVYLKAKIVDTKPVKSSREIKKQTVIVYCKLSWPNHLMSNIEDLVGGTGKVIGNRPECCERNK